jgi:hypothetical protein
MDAYNPTPVWQMYGVPQPGAEAIPSIGGSMMGGNGQAPGLQPIKTEPWQDKATDGAKLAKAAGMKETAGMLGEAASLGKTGIGLKLMGLL